MQMQMEIQQTNLIKMKHSKEHIQLTSIQQNISQFPKYFFSVRQNITILYDKSILYILHKQSTKVVDLGKQYVITDLVYHFDKNILVFLTIDSLLHLHFVNSKTQIIIKRQVKKQKPILFDWIYDSGGVCNFFIADQSGVKLYKLQQDKKNLKQVKNISGKYNSFLYDPESQVLVGFPIGDCKNIQTFIFQPKKANNWFKGFQMGINFQHDQNLVNSVKKNKSLGLQYGRHNKDVFSKIQNEQYFSTLIRMNQKTYLALYFANEGLLKLYPLVENNQKQLSIKLPSDSIPSFNVIDNMLIVHLKNQKITFIYDVAAQHIQPLVSPFPLTHMNQTKLNLYQCQFVGHRIIHPSGIISKWKINLEVIHSYLKNQLQIFDFYYRRRKAKMQMLKWLRQDLFKIKQLNLSRFWKLLFAKYQTNQYPQADIVSLIQIYGNIFYTLSLEELIPRQTLMNIIIQCVRQALDVQMKIPFQLQRLLFSLLIQFKKNQLLIYLSHNEVIKDSQELIKELIKQYQATNQIMLATLAVDMAYRISTCQGMVQILFKLQRVRDGKKYIKQNYDKVQVLYFIQVAKYIRNEAIKKQYIKYIKTFILQKFPAMNVTYLDEAQKKILGGSPTS